MPIKNLFLPAGLLVVAASAAVAAADVTQVTPPAPLFTVQTPAALARNAKSLSAAVAIAANDVWAVGEIITHFNGGTWSLIATPANGGQLADVVALATNDVWAAGSIALAGGGSQTLVERWNGSLWSVVATPALSGQEARFSGIVAFSDTNVWAAGSYVVGVNVEPLFEHWNGRTWTIVNANIPGTHFIAKLAAVSPTDMWAVGSNGGGDDGSPFAEHWDGNSWTPVTVPSPGVGGMLSNVRALSSSNVWAVGSQTLAAVGSITITANPIQTLIEHWNGRVWSVVPSPNVGVASVFQENRLFGLGVLSGKDIWAVGQFALPDGSTKELALALRWNGVAWSIASVPDVGTLSTYSGVATLGPSAVWIVGVGGFPALVTGFGPLIAHAPHG